MYNIFSYDLTLSSLLTYLITSSILGLLLTLISYVLTIRHYDAEKISAYECGFQPFANAREIFDIRYYIVALLFVLFDLEVLFLFPWTLYIGVSHQCFYGVLSGYIFLALLCIGFIYEWRNGALEWE
jgi:NADH-quinone oxidoreductase subunit A